jgi:hypothetical protein
MADRSMAAGTTKPMGGLATGMVLFAGIVMIVSGVFQALAGITAIFQGSFYAVTPKYVYELDVSTWGWIHLVLGVVVLLAGFGVMSGNLLARIVGIVLAVLSAFANFMFIPHYPIWSLLIIGLDVLVIWALAVSGQPAEA